MATEGRYTEAELLFARLARGDDIDVLVRYGNFLRRLGRLAQAEAIFLKVIDLGTHRNPAWVARGYGYMGLIQRKKGNLDRSEELHLKALDIYESIGAEEGQAQQYANLGTVSKLKGSFVTAEANFQRSLEMYQSLGDLHGKGIALTGLGNIKRCRGELGKAKSLLEEALALNESAESSPESLANNLTNLGALYLAMKEPATAKKFFERALIQHKHLDHKEGQAIALSNLGIVLMSVGSLDAALERFEEAMQLNNALGRRQGVAIQHGNIAELELRRGNLNKAELRAREALAIDESLRRRDGIAYDYSMLARIYTQLGHGSISKEFWETSRRLYQDVGVDAAALEIQIFLDGLAAIDLQDAHMPGSRSK